MQFTAINTIPSLEGKPRELRLLFAETANTALSKGRTQDEAIFQGLAVVKQKEQREIKKYVKPSVPRHLQALLDIRNNPQAHQEALQEPQIDKANLPQGNDVIGAQFDPQGRLILKLADGKTITSNVAPITAIENNVVVVNENLPELSGGTANQVLVKVSDTDKDFEWQDMIVNVPEYTRLVDQLDANVMYIGEAAPASLVCNPEWRIKKVTQSGQDITILWANGISAFDKIWDNRLTYTYSVDCP